MRLNMGNSRAIGQGAIQAPAVTGRWARAGRCLSALTVWGSGGRATRIALLLVLVWMVGLADLKLTLLAAQTDEFSEGNPVAAAMLHSPGLLASFKLAALSIASLIFLTFRKHWFAEAGCWFICIVHMVLAAFWKSYVYGLS